MGLFGGSVDPVDPELAQKLAASDQELKRAHTALAKNQDLIKSDLSANGEKLLLIAAGTFSATVAQGILVVTDVSSTAYFKGKREKSISHSDVAGTTLGQMPRGSMLVAIETFAARLDYKPNDPKRFAHIIQMELETQRPAQAICATIDAITGRA